MKSSILPSLFVCVLILIPAAFARSQCSNLTEPKTYAKGYEIAEAEPDDPKLPKIELAALKVTLDKESRFKISLDSPINTDFIKSNDQIAFSVIENVYGTTTPISVVTDDKTKVRIPGKRCLVIPKKAKLYGIVDYAKPSYPFYFRGKARLYVYVDKVVLENGAEVKINFAEPVTQVDPKKPVIRTCKRDSDKNCITGRRSKLKFTSAIIAVGAGTGIAVVKDETTDGIIALGFLQSLAGVSGVDNLINPPNAILNKDMIFDVVTVEDAQVWVKLEKPAAEKKDEKPE